MCMYCIKSVDVAESLQVLQKNIAENLQVLQIMCSYCRKRAENMQKICSYCRKSAGIAENLQNRIPASKRSTSEITEDNTVKTTGNGSTIGDVIMPRIRNRSTKDFETKGKEK